jgi:hypothetical protein
MLTPNRTKLSERIHSVIAIRPKSGGLVTTLSANAAAGATTATLTSVTGAGDNDPHLFGSEEDVEMRVQSGAPVGSVVTIDAPGFKRAHVTGEAVREGIAYDLGNVVNVNDGSTADTADNETDVSINPDGRRMGHLALMPQCDIQGWSPQLFALAAGVDLAKVLGAATAADPTQLHLDGSEFGRVDTALVLTELLADGTYLRHDYDACFADYTQLRIPFGQGRETLLAARFIASNHAERNTAAPGMLVDYTLQARKALQIESLLEAGLFTVTGGGLSTTTTSATTVGGNTVGVASASGIAAGKWYRIVGGGKEQVIFVHSLASLDVTARTRFAYVFPVGSTWVELTQVPFTGLKEGTTEFVVGGSLKTPPKFDNMRVQAGGRPGSALFTLQAQPTARTLDLMRQRLALPAGAISGTALIESDLAGTDHPVGWYARAQMKNTNLCYFIGSSCDNGLEQLGMAMSKNDLTGTPLAFRNQLLTQLRWAV